jgi:glycosyltransferase involved in cell wall biosynthesis
MTSRPLVSILIPAHNAGRWIADSIASAVGQTWARTEIVVVDDGSSDGTEGIARTFENKGVRVISQANQGAAAARNAAYAACSGDYIQWLDADDLLDRDKIDRQVRAVTAADARILLSGEWGTFHTRPERARFIRTPLWDDLSPVEFLRRKMQSGKHFMAIESWLVSRELAEAAGPWDPRLAVDDDGEYFCRVLRAASHVRFVAGSRVRVRRSGTTGVSHIGDSSVKIEAQLLSCELHVEYLRSMQDSEATREASRDFVQKYVAYVRPTKPEHVQRAQALLESVGGRLEIPDVRSPYGAIHAALGARMAERARRGIGRVKRTLRSLRERTRAQ